MFRHFQAGGSDPGRQLRRSPSEIAAQPGAERHPLHRVVAKEPERLAGGVVDPRARLLAAVTPLSGADGAKVGCESVEGLVVDARVIPKGRGKQVARGQRVPVVGDDRHHLTGFFRLQVSGDGVPLLAPEPQCFRRRGRRARGRFRTPLADILDLQRPVDGRRHARRHIARGRHALRHRDVPLPADASGQPVAQFPEPVFRNDRRDVQLEPGKRVVGDPADEPADRARTRRRPVVQQCAVGRIQRADVHIQSRLATSDLKGHLPVDLLGQPVGDAHDREGLRVDPHDRGD